MPKGKTKKSKLDFTQKLLLNQWLISLFGVDPLAAKSRFIIWWNICG